MIDKILQQYIVIWLLYKNTKGNVSMVLLHMVLYIKVLYYLSYFHYTYNISELWYIILQLSNSVI